MHLVLVWRSLVLIPQSLFVVYKCDPFHREPRTTKSKSSFSYDPGSSGPIMMLANATAIQLSSHEQILTWSDHYLSRKTDMVIVLFFLRFGLCPYKPFVKWGLSFGLVRECHYTGSSHPVRNRSHFADDIFKCIFVNEKFRILIKISLRFVPRGPIDNNPALD